MIQGYGIKYIVFQRKSFNGVAIQYKNERDEERNK